MNPSNTCTCGHDKSEYIYGYARLNCVNFNCTRFTPTADSTDEHQHGDNCKLVMAIRNTDIEAGTALLDEFIAAHDRRRDEEHVRHLITMIESDGAPTPELERLKRAIRAEFADTEDTK